MMARTPRRHRREPRRREARVTWPAVLIIAIAVAATAGSLGAGVYLTRFESEQQRADKLMSPNNDNNAAGRECPDNDKLESHTILLVDATEGLTGDQRQILRNLAADLRSRLAVGARLTILSLNPDYPYYPNRWLSDCRPAASGFDRSPREARLALKAFSERFNGRLDDVVKIEDALRSPILETLKFISDYDGFSDSVPVREVYIASDMLQHMKRLPNKADRISMINDRYKRSFEAYRGTDHFRMNGETSWAGVDVRIYQLRYARRQKDQTVEVRDFWDNYFRASGASQVSWENTAKYMLAPIEETVSKEGTEADQAGKPVTSPVNPSSGG